MASLDEDRILRAYLSVIRATLRTNYYQTMDGGTDAAGAVKSWLSFKLDPHAIPDLPLPLPKFEIFVYSPRVEGVHLRMGYVARGGIRWSDRREDFRTEVLGLMKAQNVKNTVIVPVGAKGGFYPKRLPAGGSREDMQKEGIASYQTFIRGLLDVTDNIVHGTTVCAARRRAPRRRRRLPGRRGRQGHGDVLRHRQCHFHRVWPLVRRRLRLGRLRRLRPQGHGHHRARRLGMRQAALSRDRAVDIQSQDFTCAGIGDMSGDVFGNGMLLSKHIRLVAAFDHRHIFLDPNPDAAAGFRERERLVQTTALELGRLLRASSSRAAAACGRAAPSPSRSPPRRATLLGLEASAATPVEVMRAILRMPVDLLWNGGIGTYVKAHDETHAEVRDRANDAIRADGREIRARVIGEGGNLGCTQRGRVEYARLGGSEKPGGRVNTDFIDNSAGVNTSDLEVNIKILLADVSARGRLTLAARNKLLASMTGEVAALVLRNNYLQSQAISVLEQRAAERLTEYQSLVRALERGGYLNRAIEFLPGDEEFQERRKQKLGLTRPELVRGAGLQQDLAQQSPARLRSAGRPVLCRPRCSVTFRRPRASAMRAKSRAIA